MEPHFRLWLEEKGEPVFGEGVWQLLVRVNTLGSINQAAKSISMSYRQAWGHIHKLEQRLGMRLLDRQVGGESGGGATLTPAGRELLERYELLQKEVGEAVHKAFKRHFPS